MPNLFKRRSPEDAYVAETMKKIRQRKERTLAIAEASGKLTECRLFFQRTVDTSRLNVMRRREARLSDALEKERIHDAIVGLLAVEEAELDLRSVSTQQDLEYAMRSLEQVIRQMYRMSPNSTDLSKKELRANTGMDVDDSMEPITFSSRAELVDETFVERVIQGYSVKDCIEQMNNTVNSVGSGSGDGDDIDFTSYPKGRTLSSEEEELLKKQADKR